MRIKSKIYSLIITEECNLNCRYCYAQKGNRKKMNEKTAELVYKYLKKDILQNKIANAGIIFSGNEPLLNFAILKKIFRNLSKDFKKDKKNHLSFGIFSNLCLMDRKTLKWLKNNGFYIHTSLDGSQDIHDFQRGKGSFKKTTFWIKEIIKEGIPLNVSAVITRFSLDHWKEMIDTYLKLGLKSINFRALHPIGLGEKNWSKLSYSPEEFIEFRRKSLDYILKINRSGYYFVEQKTLFLFNKIQKNIDSIFLMSPPCAAITKQICIDPRGDIYTCDEGRSRKGIFKIGNIKKGINLIKAQTFFLLVHLATEKNCIKKKCKINDLCGPCLAINDSPLICNKFRCSIYKKEIDYFINLSKKKSFRNLMNKWEKEQSIFLKWQ